MLLFPRVQFLLVSILLTFISFPLSAAQKSIRIKPFKNPGYLFTTSYLLQAPSESSDLRVDLLAEYNMGNSNMLQGDSWLPFSHLMELRFSVKGKPKKMEMWPSNNTFDIQGLDTIRSSIWLTAVKDLAESFGKQYYGVNTKPSPIPSKNLSKDPANITIQPLSNHKLRSIYKLLIHQKKNRYSIDVDIHIEEKMHQRKKMCTASAVFSEKGKLAVIENPSSIKFVQTKYGLKEISRQRLRPSSKLYSAVKKAVQESVDRYLKFKRMHFNVIRSSSIHIPPLGLVDAEPEEQDDNSQRPRICAVQ